MPESLGNFPLICFIYLFQKIKIPSIFEVEVSNLNCFYFSPKPSPRGLEISKPCGRTSPNPRLCGAKVARCSVHLGVCHLFPQAILDTFHLGEDQQVGTKEQGPNARGSPRAWNCWVFLFFAWWLEKWSFSGSGGSEMKAHGRTSDRKCYCSWLKFWTRWMLFFGEIHGEVFHQRQVQDARWRMSLTRSRMETTAPLETSPRKPIKPVLVWVSWDHGDLQWIHVFICLYDISERFGVHHVYIVGVFLLKKMCMSSVRLAFSSQLISDKIKLQKFILPVHLMAQSKPFNNRVFFSSADRRNILRKGDD